MRRLPFRAPRFGLAFARAAGVLAVTGLVSTVAAEPEFPGVIQDHFKAVCAPQCTLCHTSPTGGSENLKSADLYVDGTQPSHRGYGVFISNLADRTGISGIGATTLVAKLDALKAEACQDDASKGDTSDMGPCDSDGDGTSDYDELVKGFDPETPGAGAECPAYGCGASIGTLPRDAQHSGRAGAVMAALGVALVLARRIRR